MTPLEHVVALGQILDSLEIPWVLGGSLASSVVGEPRSTVDVDIAVALRAERVPDLVGVVAADYYVDESMAADAATRNSSFNLIHFATGMKIDLFVLGEDPLDVRQLERRQRVAIDDDISIWVGAPDDQVLRKLRWYRMGGEVSDRQWRDVLAILRVQGERIAASDLIEAARLHGLTDLVERALAEVSGERSSPEAGA